VASGTEAAPYFGLAAEGYDCGLDGLNVFFSSDFGVEAKAARDILQYCNSGSILTLSP
jgi:hypothetical protein